MASFANFLGFQAVWFACVLGAARGAPWIGPVAALVFGVACLERGRRARSAAALTVVALLGAALDALLIATRALGYPHDDGRAPELLAPPWIVALWFAFAATFRLSMRWLGGRIVLQIALGLLGSPLSYLGAERLGAVRIGEDRFLSLAVLGGAWAVVFPLTFALERRIRGPSEPPR